MSDEFSPRKQMPLDGNTIAEAARARRTGGAGGDGVWRGGVLGPRT